MCEETGFVRVWAGYWAVFLGLGVWLVPCSSSMTSGVTVRWAKREDAGVVLELIRGLAEYERMIDQVTGTEEMVVENLLGENPGAEVLIGEIDGFPQGFALFFHTFSTFLCRRGMYLEDLYVRPEARGKGLGKALISAVAKVAVERGCGRMEWSVLDWNEPSIEFYKSLGAAPMDEWTVFRVAGEGVSAVAEASDVLVTRG